MLCHHGVRNEKNLQILQEIRQQSGCKILLAQKAFSMYSCYPLIGEYLDGTTASGLYEAKLGKECMGKENHIFLRHIGKMNLKKCWQIVSIWYSILFSA